MMRPVLTIRPRRAACTGLVPAIAALAALAALAGCGGSNPLDNPTDIANPPGATGQKLSFAYFQKCINPIFKAQLKDPRTGAINQCAGSGCHDNTSGTGGAFRVVGEAQVQSLSAPVDTIRASEMYRNFYSAQASVVAASAEDSRLLNKPLLRGVLHGGGLIFADEQDPNARLIRYWIENPAQLGEDEFSPTTYGMFTPANPAGQCNTR